MAFFDLPHFDLAPCRLLGTCRIFTQIIWSCTATILACVWSAVNRNVPAPPPPNEPFFWNGFKRWFSGKLEAAMLVCLALILPEWVLAWAIRQWMVAHRLARELQTAKSKARTSKTPSTSSADNQVLTMTGAAWEYTPDVKPYNEVWTTTHAFFVLSGGYFYVDSDDKPRYPLSPAQVLTLVENNGIFPPTELELRDRSQNDGAPKILAMLQILWFAVNCMARLGEHLPLTCLEVGTLAQTAISLPMFIFWWSKPLNAGCPIHVPEQPGNPQSGNPQPEYTRSSSGSWSDTVVAFGLGEYDELADLQTYNRAPTFYSGKPEWEEYTVADIVALLAAMVMGAIYCIAWGNEFPTTTEKHLWRVSAILMVVVPVLPSLALVLCRWALNRSPKNFKVLMWCVGAPSIAVYIVARFLLIAIALTALRALPPAMFRSIVWSSFLPHF